MINNKQFYFKSVMAGFLISFAGWIYLQCSNKVVGSILFSIGLIAVILFQANLYTGKIGYMNTKKKIKEALVMLVVNLIIAYAIGLIYRYTIGEISFQSRLDKEWYRLLLDGFGCGVCIYLAVELYNKTKNILLIIFPVVCFILGGMEHSIADTFYFGASQFSIKGLIDIMLVIIGNSLGSLFIRLIQTNMEKNN